MKLPRLWRTSLTLDFRWGEANLNVASWHFATFRTHAPKSSYWTAGNYGQRSGLGLNGSVANDP